METGATPVLRVWFGSLGVVSTASLHLIQSGGGGRGPMDWGGHEANSGRAAIEIALFCHFFGVNQVAFMPKTLKNNDLSIFLPVRKPFKKNEKNVDTPLLIWDI